MSIILNVTNQNINFFPCYHTFNKATSVSDTDTANQLRFCHISHTICSNN